MQYPLSSLVLGPRNYVTKVTLEQGRCYDSSASLIGEPITLFELGLIKAGRIIFIARAHDFSGGFGSPTNNFGSSVQNTREVKMHGCLLTRDNLEAKEGNRR